MSSATSHKGDVALLKFFLRASEKQLLVSRPISESSRYDAILDTDGELLRVQAKYAGSEGSRSSGCFVVKTESPDCRGKKAKRYTSNEVDFIAAYTPVTDKVYLLPVSLWEGKRSITLRYQPAKNNQKAKCVDASQWEW